ncbi:hypothetical protein BDK51DRAFT_52365 [Blyttiomyces helicus]|uniref:Uncharacterized protein n=1 Tax=Blyttiomyces helicus TaxID=388810 RepID=A0A4P9VXT6_9FUNG|nr:hypothetical protein BDK51DRAFT_52365 [Blyttiomyces helicus]|eukprot:RKO84554.1 hypothetical protein BDK51DRAFT_52365 [Blyttiomyces helicus]
MAAVRYSVAELFLLLSPTALLPTPPHADEWDVLPEAAMYHVRTAHADVSLCLLLELFLPPTTLFLSLPMKLSVASHAQLFCLSINYITLKATAVAAVRYPDAELFLRYVTR